MPVGDGVRVDAGYEPHDVVTPYYDAMIAKLIAHGADRAQALDRLLAGLRKFEIGGVTTNIPFLKALAGHELVRRGEFDTGFIERELAELIYDARPLAAIDAAAAVAAVLLRERQEDSADPSPWGRGDGWMMAGRRLRNIIFQHGKWRSNASVEYGRDGVTVAFEGTSRPLSFIAREADAIDVTFGKTAAAAHAVWTGRDLDLVMRYGRFRLHWVDPFSADLGDIGGADRIVAPMPGTVTRIFAEPGTDVARGTPLIVMEAMKMEHTLRAPADGHLKALKCAVGDFVQEGAELADFEIADAKD